MQLRTTGTISSRVAAELARARITGRELADALGWKHDYTRRRIRGEVRFAGEELDAIAAFLGVPVSRFFTDGGDRS